LSKKKKNVQKALDNLNGLRTRMKEAEEAEEAREAAEAQEMEANKKILVEEQIKAAKELGEAHGEKVLTPDEVRDIMEGRNEEEFVRDEVNRASKAVEAQMEKEGANAARLMKLLEDAKEIDNKKMDLRVDANAGVITWDKYDRELKKLQGQEMQLRRIAKTDQKDWFELQRIEDAKALGGMYFQYPPREEFGHKVPYHKMYFYPDDQPDMQPIFPDGLIQIKCQGSPSITLNKNFYADEAEEEKKLKEMEEEGLTFLYKVDPQILDRLGDESPLLNTWWDLVKAKVKDQEIRMWSSGAPGNLEYFEENDYLGTDFSRSITKAMSDLGKDPYEAMHLWQMQDTKVVKGDLVLLQDGKLAIALADFLSKANLVVRLGKIAVVSPQQDIVGRKELIRNGQNCHVRNFAEGRQSVNWKVRAAMAKPVFQISMKARKTYEGQKSNPRFEMSVYHKCQPELAFKFANLLLAATTDGFTMATVPDGYARAKLGRAAEGGRTEAQMLAFEIPRHHAVDWPEAPKLMAEEDEVCINALKPGDVVWSKDFWEYDEGDDFMVIKDFEDNGWDDESRDYPGAPHRKYSNFFIYVGQGTATGDVQATKALGLGKTGIKIGNVRLLPMDQRRITMAGYFGLDTNAPPFTSWETKITVDDIILKDVQDDYASPAFWAADMEAREKRKMVLVKKGIASKPEVKKRVDISDIIKAKNEPSVDQPLTKVNEDIMDNIFGEKTVRLKGQNPSRASNAAVFADPWLNGMVSDAVKKQPYENWEKNNLLAPSSPIQMTAPATPTIYLDAAAQEQQRKAIEKQAREYQRVQLNKEKLRKATLEKVSQKLEETATRYKRAQKKTKNAVQVDDEGAAQAASKKVDHRLMAEDARILAFELKRKVQMVSGYQEYIQFDTEMDFVPKVQLLKKTLAEAPDSEAKEARIADLQDAEVLVKDLVGLNGKVAEAYQKGSAPTGIEEVEAEKLKAIKQLDEVEKFAVDWYQEAHANSEAMPLLEDIFKVLRASSEELKASGSNPESKDYERFKLGEATSFWEKVNRLKKQPELQGAVGVKFQRVMDQVKGLANYETIPDSDKRVQQALKDTTIALRKASDELEPEIQKMVSCGQGEKTIIVYDLKAILPKVERAGDMVEQEDKTEMGKVAQIGERLMDKLLKPKMFTLAAEKAEIIDTVNNAWVPKIEADLKKLEEVQKSLKELEEVQKSQMSEQETEIIDTKSFRESFELAKKSMASYLAEIKEETRALQADIEMKKMDNDLKRLKTEVEEGGRTVSRRQNADKENDVQPNAAFKRAYNAARQLFERVTDFDREMKEKVKSNSEEVDKVALVREECNDIARQMKEMQWMANVMQARYPKDYYAVELIKNEIEDIKEWIKETRAASSSFDANKYLTGKEVGKTCFSPVANEMEWVHQQIERLKGIEAIKKWSGFEKSFEPAVRKLARTLFMCQGEDLGHEMHQILRKVATLVNAAKATKPGKDAIYLASQDQILNQIKSIQTQIKAAWAGGYKPPEGQGLTAEQLKEVLTTADALSLQVKSVKTESDIQGYMGKDGDDVQAQFKSQAEILISVLYRAGANEWGSAAESMYQLYQKIWKDAAERLKDAKINEKDINVILAGLKQVKEEIANLVTEIAKKQEQNDDVIKEASIFVDSMAREVESWKAVADEGRVLRVMEYANNLVTKLKLAGLKDLGNELSQTMDGVEATTQGFVSTKDAFGKPLSQWETMAHAKAKHLDQLTMLKKELDEAQAHKDR